MSDDTDRPQDAGRRHRRRGAPSAETATLLADAQAALRDELRFDLAELRGPLPDPGLGLVDQPRQRPATAERSRLVDLIVKIMNQLGTEIDERPESAESPGVIPIRKRRARIDFGPD